jgi:hypothetical protein
LTIAFIYAIIVRQSGMVLGSLERKMIKKYAANAVSLLAAAVAILLISDQEIVGAGIWLIFSVLANMNARTEEIIVVAKGITDAVE